MAANLNTKLALLSLEMNDIKKPVNDDEITENDKFEYYQSLVVSMNSKMNDLLKENEELKAQQIRSIPQEPQTIIQVVNNTSGDIDRIRDLAVDLNQRLSVLTLNSNDEVKFLKKQLAQKETEVNQYRNKLASMNRQIIDLTFNSNLERQQYADANMVQSREININENSNYEAVINEKDLIIKQLQEQLAQMNAQSNNSVALMAELENEKRKNQELNQTINNMRNEVQSISDYVKETTSLVKGLNVSASNSAINEEIASIAEYLKETKRCLEDYQKANTQEMSLTSNNVSVNEEIVSLANYLKETKRCLEDFRDSNSQEINSISEYLKDTIKMAEEYKANL